MPLLSVIIPVYNEEKTIGRIVQKISSLNIDKEIIVVNDASIDKTGEILNSLKLPNIKIFSHNSNLGKGAAFITGLKNSSGEIVVIQDADLEYDPCDYPRLIPAIIHNQADLVLGVRFTKGYKGLLAHQLGNRLLTGILNILYGSHLSDTYTCYKVARKSLFDSFNLSSNDFGIDQEIISKALKAKIKIKEVPVSYHPRSYSEGKKIRFYDAFKIIVEIVKLRFKGE